MSRRPSDFDARLAAWLEEGPTSGPEEVLSKAFARARSMRQDRVWLRRIPLPMRFQTMKPMITFTAAAAVALAVALALGASACGDDDEEGGAGGAAPPGTAARSEPRDPGSPPEGEPAYRGLGTWWSKLPDDKRLSSAVSFIEDNPGRCAGVDPVDLERQTGVALGFDFPAAAPISEVMLETCALLRDGA
jgi:hypothetical protein